MATAPRGGMQSLIAHLRTPLFANAYALVLNTGGNAALGVLYWVAAARLYAPEVVGRNAALLAAMMLISGIAQLNLEAIIIRVLPTLGPQAPRFILGAYAATLSLTLAVSAIFLWGLPLWSPELGILRADVALGLWFVLATGGWTIFHLQDSVIAGLRQTIWVPIENIGFGLAKIILLIVMAGTFDRAGIFIAWTLPALLLIPPVNLLIFRRLLPRHQREGPAARLPSRSAFIRMVAGDYVGYLCFLAATTLLPLLVTNRLGPDANAYFYQAWIIAYSLMLVAMNVTTSLTVEAARSEAMLHDYGRRIVRQALTLLGPAVLVVVVGAPLILRVFGESYAREGTAALRLLALAALPSIPVFIGVAQARLQRRMAEVVLIQGVGSLLVLGVSVVLLDRMGTAGVGVAWLLSQGLIALVLLASRVRWLLARRSTPGA